MSRRSRNQNVWTGVMMGGAMGAPQSVTEGLERIPESRRGPVRRSRPSPARAAAARCAPGVAQSLGDAQSAPRGGDIMGADDARAQEHRDRGGGEPGLEPLVGRQPERPAEEALPRNADQDRASHA